MTEVSFETLGEQSIDKFLTRHFGDRSFKAFQLAGDASARRYFRIVYNDSSWVLMVWEPFEDNGEYPFLNIQKKWKSMGIPVPNVISYDAGLGLVLLDDLGDLTLERKFWENQNQESVLPLYIQTLDRLSQIHFGESAGQKTYVAQKTSFNIEKFMWEFNYALKHFLINLCKIELADGDRRELERIFLDICQTLDNQPKVVCHRDLHSRNLMVKLGKVFFIDFQDARLGPVQYDLVSLFKDSYVDLSDDIHDHLLRWYFDEFVVRHQPGSFEDFKRIYEVQSIQRCFKACGSFASFFNLRHDTRYLKYLPKTVQTVKQSLKLFPEYSFFSDLLEKNKVCRKKFEVA